MPPASTIHQSRSSSVSGDTTSLRQVGALGAGRRSRLMEVIILGALGGLLYFLLALGVGKLLKHNSTYYPEEEQD